MPFYLYRTPDGELHDWQCSMKHVPQSLYVGGMIAERDIAAEHTGQKSGDPWTDHTSLALAVHPADIKKYEADAKKKGVRVDFNDQGLPKFRSRAEQRDYCKAYGYVNFQDSW